jgi:cytochrome c
MKRIALFSIASAIGLISTAAFSQFFSNFDVDKAMEIAGRKVVADRCAVCHAQKVGARPIGPSLSGVVGRPAASLAGFPYSDALKKSGLTWTDDNLRAWIADPSHTVPGTLMPHVSLSDPAEQLYVIAYLKTLSGKATR